MEEGYVTLIHMEEVDVYFGGLKYKIGSNSWILSPWPKTPASLSFPLRHNRVILQRLGATIWYFECLSRKLSSSNGYSRYRHARPTNIVAPKKLPSSNSIFPRKTIKLGTKVWWGREWEKKLSICLFIGYSTGEASYTRIDIHWNWKFSQVFTLCPNLLRITLLQDTKTGGW